jgi:hypothetical protein
MLGHRILLAFLETDLSHPRRRSACPLGRKYFTAATRLGRIFVEASELIDFLGGLKKKNDIVRKRLRQDKRFKTVP